MTKTKLFFGNSIDMSELKDDSIHLVITSPPYYNAPFDYPELFENYDAYLEMINSVSIELKRVLSHGRIAAFVIDDTLIKGHKYPIVADIINIFVKNGFRYRDRLMWLKPEGYIRISKRSGVLLQHPYPMYFYPDNLQESIVLFQNGRFDYKTIDSETREKSKIDIDEVKANKWYMNTWYITNVLPRKNGLENGIAAFPEEIPYRLVKLFSYKDEWVLDPFVGSGTTLKVARDLGRNSIGYDIDVELKDIILKKIGYFDDEVCRNNTDVIVREDVERLRTVLAERVRERYNLN